MSDIQHFKTCVYAICKNESAFVHRFLASCAESDYIVIADTGSTDDTLDVLEAAKRDYPNLIVHTLKVSPWRFDMARDALLAFCPTDADIMLSIDLDEVLVKGWYQELQEKWTPQTDRAWYDYIWRFRVENGVEVPDVQFRTDKIHGRWGYHWVNPVHEVATKYEGSPEIAIQTSIMVEHHPDDTKSRGQYLPGLEMAVRERPFDARALLYCARERGFHGDYVGEAAGLQKYLTMDGTWHAERSYAYTLLGAHCSDNDRALDYLAHAITEDPKNISAYYWLCSVYSQQGLWLLALSTAKRALEGPTERYYFTDGRATPRYFYHAGAFAAMKLGDFDAATTLVDAGLSLYPDDAGMVHDRPYLVGEIVS